MGVPAYGYSHHPSSFDGYETPSSGFANPSNDYGYSEDPPLVPSFALVTTNATGEFGDDGGALVELYAPAADLPSLGPYRVRLVDANGALWPPADLPGCPAAIAGSLDDVAANASYEYLRFALPVLPQGTYGVMLTWDDGMSTATFDDMILVVPADTSMEALWLGDSMR